MKYSKEELINDLINFSANMKHPYIQRIIDESAEKENYIRDTLAWFEREWNEAPDDDEAYTDKLLDEYAELIINALK